MVFDTESVTVGQYVGPYLSGFYDGKSVTHFYSKKVSVESHRDFFFEYLESILERDTVIILWGHNIEWDFGQLFSDSWGLLDGDSLKVELMDNQREMEIIFSQPCFGHYSKNRDSHYKILFRDTFAFFKTSLEKLSQKIGGRAKLTPPPGLGKRKIPWEEIRPYFLADLHSTYDAANYLTERFVEHGLPSVPVSIPHFASTVFRKSLTVELERFPEPKLAMSSYFGGKTRCFPGLYENMNCYDVNSEYPWAMQQLPKLCCGTYQTVSNYQGPWGVYILKDYEYRPCEYGTLYHSKIKVKNETLKFLEKPIPDLIVNGFDIESAFYCHSLKIHKCVGWIWKPSPCDHPNVFFDYVQRFYLLRNQAKKAGNDIFSEYYKLMMNSLYGKFSQLRYNPKKLGWQPGTLFDPLVAGWITGLGRMRIHEYEHLANSVYTSTDSLITSQTLPTSDKLGELKHEFFAKWVVILRSKVYFAFDDKFNLLKCALHGIQGQTPLSVLKAMAFSAKTVTRKKLIKRKEGIRRNITTGRQINRKQSLETLEITPAQRDILKKGYYQSIDSTITPVIEVTGYSKG